jgi:hypothetical protein
MDKIIKMVDSADDLLREASDLLNSQIDYPLEYETRINDLVCGIDSAIYDLGDTLDSLRSLRDDLYR